MDEAMIHSILSSVFGKPAGGTGTPAQTQQAGMGHLGGIHGRNQGYIGASVPQTSNPGVQASALGPGGAGGRPGGSEPSSGSAGPQGGGLTAMLPLLLMALPHLLPVLAQLLGGGAGQTSQRPGTI